MTEDFLEDTLHVETHVHVVFSTEQQEPRLADEALQRATRDEMKAVCEKLGAVVHGIAVAAEHVHVLLRLPHLLSLDECVADLKQQSALWLRRRGGDLKAFAWQQSFVAQNLETYDIPGLQAELADQAAFHRDVAFKTEVMQMLSRMEVTWTAEVWR